MKKFILYSVLFLFVAAIAIAGGVYYQKKEQLAELEKTGLQFLSEGLDAGQEGGNNSGSKTSNEPGAGSSGEIDSLPSVESIDIQDKLAVAKIVLSKVPAEELNEFREMTKGGITPEEKNKAKEMLEARLSKDDINALKDIVQKYKN